MAAKKIRKKRLIKTSPVFCCTCLYLAIDHPMNSIQVSNSAVRPTPFHSFFTLRYDTPRLISRIYRKNKSALSEFLLIRKGMEYAPTNPSKAISCRLYRLASYTVYPVNTIMMINAAVEEIIL